MYGLLLSCALLPGQPAAVMLKGAHMLQISGHVTDEEGKKRIALVGMWNSHLDMQKCDEEGTPLPGSQLVRLWTVSGQSSNGSCAPV